LIGCDGLHSRTGILLFPSSPPVVFQGYMGYGGLVPCSVLSSEPLASTHASEGAMTVTRGSHNGLVGITEMGKCAHTGERQLFVWANPPLSLENASPCAVPCSVSSPSWHRGTEVAPC
jgi:hypothetical protein